MKQIRLNKLLLKNFKGARDISLVLRGSETTIFGDNSTYKTTCADAFSWLLFGKDSQGHADFDIKTLDSSGQALHGLDHAVEAVLDVDGCEMTFRKVYREKWTKKRGSAEKEFTGHTKDHFVDGVPVTQSEYEERIAGLADEKWFRLLTSPSEFAERLHWQERRGILLDVCGDISDADVIALNPELADLADILGGRSIDDHRKVIQAQRRKINGELEKIPVRIDETSRGLPEFVGGADKLKPELEALRAQRRDAESKLSRIEAGGEIAEKTKRLREIEAKILNEANKESTSRQAEVGQLRTKLAEAQIELDDAVRCVARFEKDISEAERGLSGVEPRMTTLRKLWNDDDAANFEAPTVDDVCAACGQKLPAESAEHAQSKAKAQFNLEKACRLKDISDEGKRLKCAADELRGKVGAWQKELEYAKKAETTFGDSVAKLKEEIVGLTVHQSHIPSNHELELLNEKSAIQVDIEKLKTGSLGAISEVKEKVSEIDRHIAAIERALSKIEQRRVGEKRIERLGQEERRLAGEFEGLERQLYLLDEFTRCKVSMLTDQINSRFELARFKLFNVLVNGALEECCEITHDGVPWGSLNGGSQVNTGLEIIDVLAEHYGLAPCIWIDRAESTTSIRPTRGQQLRLIVSAGDDVLRVETAAA